MLGLIATEQSRKAARSSHDKPVFLLPTTTSSLAWALRSFFSCFITSFGFNLPILVRCDHLKPFSAGHLTHPLPPFSFNSTFMQKPPNVEATLCFSTPFIWELSLHVLGCKANLLATCPDKLQYRSMGGHRPVVGCKSGCKAFGTDELCCRNHYNSPQTCRASSFSEFFKHACPATFTFAHDSLRSRTTVLRRVSLRLSSVIRGRIASSLTYQSMRDFKPQR